MTNEGTTGARADAIELLTSQHRDVEQLWSQLQVAVRNRDDVRHELAGRIISMLSRHDAVETQLLYPALREVPGGGDLAGHGLDEHHRIRELLAAADGADPADEEVFASLEEALGTVQHHVGEEEGEMFPALRAAMTGDELTELGSHMQKAMAAAPTHPHPSTPDNPVGAAIVGAAAGVVDKVRDAVTNRR